MRSRRRRRDLSAGGLCLLILLLGGAETEASGWADRLEVHGFAASKWFVRSPGMDLSDEVHGSSLRTELHLEPSFEVYEREDLRLDLHGVLRSTYDAIYDLYPDVWGDGVGGGLLGTGGAALASAALRGRAFPGHGARIAGEFSLANDDLFTLLGGRLSPALVLSDVTSFGSAVAPVAPRGPQQRRIGGDATAATFQLRAAMLSLAGDPSLQNSLSRASLPVGTSLSFLSPRGSLGDRRSLDSLPTDVNASERALQWDCGDNAHPRCLLRELYLDLDYKDTFLRVGQQQMVWGKTDAFRLQDIVNPIDFGYQGIFAGLEERRIPLLALRGSHRLDTIGPVDDVNLELVWVFDRFRPTQLGQCGEPYAPALACQARSLVASHELTNIGIASVEERDWNLRNTEPGLRMEFRLPDPSIAFSLSAFYGFQDDPVVRFAHRYSATDPNPAAMLTLQALGLGPLIDALAGGGTPWTSGFDPYSAAEVGAANATLLAVWNGTAAAAAAAALGAGQHPGRAIYGLTLGGVPAGTYPLLALPWSGAEAVLEYPRVLTLGASLDYEIPRVDAILRIELAYDFGRKLNNTALPDGVDESDVLLAAAGLDRNVFIPLLNPNRSAFVSFQTFFEHVLSHDDGRGGGDGMVLPQLHVLSTLAIRNYWRQDRLVLSNFLAFDWNAGAWAWAPSLRWSFSSDLFLELGVRMLWGDRQEHNIRDLCADGTLGCLATSPTTWQPGQWQALNLDYRRTAEAPWWNQESFADRFTAERDEIWLGITYQF